MDISNKTTICAILHQFIGDDDIGPRYRLKIFTVIVYSCPRFTSAAFHRSVAKRRKKNNSWVNYTDSFINYLEKCMRCNKSWLIRSLKSIDNPKSVTQRYKYKRLVVIYMYNTANAWLLRNVVNLYLTYHEASIVSQLRRLPPLACQTPKEK